MSKKPNIFGRIGRFFSAVTDKVYHLIAASPVGRFFAGYTASDTLWRRSGMMQLVHPEQTHKHTHPMRRGMAHAMDRSLLRRAAYGLLGGICRCSLRTIGLFLLTTGAYSAIIAWLVHVIWQGNTVDAGLLFFGLAAAVIGVVLLFSDQSVAYALTHSALPCWLVRDALGVSEDAVKDIPREGKQQYVFAVPLGMLLGALAALLGPLSLLLSLLLLALLFLVIATPESGLLLFLVVTPFAGFLPNHIFFLTAWALLCGFGYLCKLLRGTRVLHVEIQDFVVILMLLFAMFSAVSAGGEGAISGAITAALLLSLYFPAVNMLATSHWLLRCRWALLLSATTASLMGIFQFIYAAVLAAQGAGGVSMGELAVSVRAGFATNTTFAYFLILAFPFALYAFVRSKAAQRLPTGFACVSIAAATVLTWSQSAWLTLLLEIVVVCLLCERRTFPYFVILAIILPVAIIVMPDAWRLAALNFLRDGADISVSYNGLGGQLTAKIFFEGGEGFFGRARGISRMLFGLGYGGLEAIAPLYTAGAGAAVLPNFNFWLYRLLEGGVPGVVLPALLLLFLLQNCFSLLQNARNVHGTVAPVSGIAMIFGVLLMSCFGYAWHDPVALAMFVVMISLLTADARHRRGRDFITQEVVEINESCAELDYRCVVERTQAKAKKQEVHDELQ